VRKRLLRVLVPTVIPVVLGLSAWATSASAGTVHAVSPAPATHSSGMHFAATSHLGTRLQVREVVRAARGRTAAGIQKSSAVSGQQYCFYNGGWACLNSWSGGPWVKVFTGGPNHTQNNYFTLIGGSTGSNWNLEDTGGNAWSGNCIGDAENNSGRADTSLDACGTGWGTNFTIAYGTGSNGCPDNTILFEDNHWGGWLGPPNNWVNGSSFYLNKPLNGPLYCFQIFS